MARGLIQPISELADPEREPDELRFRLGAGRVCLDLVRTVGERWRRSFERLRSPGDLDRWLLQAGLVAGPAGATRRELERARELREAVYGIARAVMDGTRPRRADIETLNAWAARPDLAPKLEAVGRRVWRGGARPVDTALSTIARDAVELFGGPLAGRVRECAASDCSGIFLDTSRGAARRWCSMAGCGNRRKVSAYRARRRAGRDRAVRGSPRPATARGGRRIDP